MIMLRIAISNCVVLGALIFCNSCSGTWRSWLYTGIFVINAEKMFQTPWICNIQAVRNYCFSQKHSCQYKDEFLRTDVSNVSSSYFEELAHNWNDNRTKQYAWWFWFHLWNPSQQIVLSEAPHRSVKNSARFIYNFIQCLLLLFVWILLTFLVIIVI